jgi:predicted nucleic acid-binding protein
MRALDTTFLTDLARGDPAAGRRAKAWSAENERLIVPAPATAALALGGHVRGGRIASRTMELLSELEIIPLGPRDALEAGRMGAELRKRGRSVDMLDLLVAARPDGTVPSWSPETRRSWGYPESRPNPTSTRALGAVHGPVRSERELHARRRVRARSRSPSPSDVGPDESEPCRGWFPWVRPRREVRGPMDRARRRRQVRDEARADPPGVPCPYALMSFPGGETSRRRAGPSATGALYLRRAHRADNVRPGGEAGCLLRRGPQVGPNGIMPSRERVGSPGPGKR